MAHRSARDLPGARPGRRPAPGPVAGLLALSFATLGLLAAAGIAPATAATREEEAEALLRAASAESAIIVLCAKHFAIDGTLALRISQTSRDVADKVLGRERAAAAFKAELARRYDEVAAVGEAQWCADQRTAMRDDGVGIFKE